MSIKILEFIIVIGILIALGITIFRLYIKNEKLLKANSLLKDKIVKIKDNNQRLSNQVEQLKEIENRYNQLLGSNLATKNELKELKNTLLENQNKIEQLSVFKQKAISLEETLKEKEQLKEEMSREFKNLSNELLESKRKILQDENRENLKLLLEPFDAQLKSFKNRLEGLNREQNQSISMLRGELLQIKELNKTLSSEAKTLSKALKGDNKIQGNWGELVLERALEASGLREGKEYKREQTFKDENVRLRADVIVYLPEDKHIVIDAKVSLKSYSQILKANGQDELKRAKQTHIISIKRHIDTLASKQYHMLSSIKAPEFTLMFIPIEAAYLMALDIDNSLYEYAFERNVAVVTPTTLLTTLKTISTLWKLANHDKNMLILAQEAASMHDKFALFLEEFIQIENRLNQAQHAYNSAKNRLLNGQGNLHSKISKIGELSGKTKKILPKIESI